MPKIAFGSIEKQSDGRWVCKTPVVVDGKSCSVKARLGQSFRPGTAFAGYQDFTSHLESVAIDAPSKAPHQWRA